MRKKSIGAIAAAVSFAICAALADGCSGDVSPAPAALVDANEVPCRCLPDGTSSGSCAGKGKCARDYDGPIIGETACYTEGDALTLTQAFSGPVAHQGKCTTGQISGFFTACFSAGDGGTDAGGICNEFIAANTACVDCINGPTGVDAGTGGPSPIILPVSATSTFLTLNVAGCVAAISTGDASCKQTYEDLSFCSNTACSSCADADAQACVDYASTDPTSICASTDVVDTTCQAAIAAVSTTDQQTECGVGTSDFETQYATIATTMCGP